MQTAAISRVAVPFMDLGWQWRQIRGRMDGIQGLILTHKLRRFDEWTKMRRAIARTYLSGFSCT